MGVILTPTSATITIRVERIAYTRERYFITYREAEKDTAEKQSVIVNGTSDIIAVNLTYDITLTGLQKIVKYNYNVTAVNCIGSTSTAEKNFITLSDGKFGCIFSRIIGICSRACVQTTYLISS